MTYVVRPAVVADAERCRDVYAPYVLETAISFETQVPDVPEMCRRIEAAIAWLVACDCDDRVEGYAYAGAHRIRDAYRYSCDVTVYVAPGAQGRGIGRLLYADLLNRLGSLGYHTAFAAIAQPNMASMALHRRSGFVEVGTFREVGWKNDAWHDVTWLQRLLAPDRPCGTGVLLR